MKKIGIIGAGKIGSQLAFDLLKEEFVSEIHLYNRSQNRLRALIQSLSIAAFQYRRNILIQEIDFKNVNALDLIIISVKESYDPRVVLTQNGYPDWFPRNLRYCGFYSDFQIIKSIVKQLSDYNGIIAVITNPVEIMTRYISDNVKAEHVFGLGASLDSFRISFLLGKDHNLDIKPNEVMVFGEHGNNIHIVMDMLPFKIKNSVVNSVVDKSGSMGFDIVKKIGYTLFDCIFAFNSDIKWLLNINPQYEYQAFSYPKNGFILSQPVYRKQEQYMYFANYSDKDRKSVSEINEKLQNLYKRMVD